MLTHLEDWAITLAPQTGGSVTRCQYKGHDILCPAREASGHADPRDMAAFPMVPFIGRIGNGEFTFEGRHIKLAPNMPPEPHAIHGLGWQSIWSTETEVSRVCLTHSHDGKTDWPWAYEAEQALRADGNTLSWQMTLTNKSDTAMPAGLGWHPYFPREGARIEADVTHIWDGEGTNYKPGAISPAADISKRRSLNALELDHCYNAGVNGVALSWPERGLNLHISASSNLRHLTVYVPPAQPYFCVEPVSHAPDAVNSALPPEVTGFQTLAPGKLMVAEVKLTAEILSV